VSRPKLVSKFTGPGQVEWKVFHARARSFPSIYKIDGRYHLGLCFFAGPRKHRIYIDSAQSDPEIFNIMLHEIMHVCLRDVGMLDVIEESVVDELATRMAFILEQL
jgi:hypothetical protein